MKDSNSEVWRSIYVLPPGMYGSTSHQQRAAVHLGTPSDPQQLLAYADRVSNWVSAEIFTWDSVKPQVALLTRYLCMGKFCYETRNFALAMQVLGALENRTVRQLPVWSPSLSKKPGSLQL